MTAPPIRLRRPNEDVRVEIVPLIDVIFLVLTFFIYAMVLMIPAKVLPMRLQPLTSGLRGQAVPAVTVSITRDGRIAVDRKMSTLETLLEDVQAAVDIAGGDPETIVYIATEESDPLENEQGPDEEPAGSQGEVLGGVDRLPLFIDLYARLARTGLNIRLVGRPGESSRN